MPRPRPEITPENLPSGYENFMPLSGDSFPISPAAKEKFDWRCGVCGFIDNFSIDNMRANPVDHGFGCKACKSARTGLSSLEQRGTANWLTVTSWSFVNDHQLARDPKRRFESIFFEGHCDQGHRQKFTRNQLKQATKNGLFCRECAAAQEHEENERLAEPVREHWRSAVIRYEGKNDFGMPHFHTLIPGTDGVPDVSAEGRFRGALDTLEKGRTVSIGKLKQMMQQDQKDRDRVKEFIDVGAQFGSVVLKIELLPGKRDLGALYLNAMGEEKGPFSLQRARDYNAGRPVKKQNQALVQCVVMEAFPGNQWSSDDRTYLAELMKHHGHVKPLSDRSELDIGTRGIVDGGLWLEYQGHQNHDDGGEAVASDEAKVQVCAGRCLLLVIPKIKEGNAVRAIQEVKHALESHSDRERSEKALAEWKDPDPDRVIQRWLAAKPEMAKDSARRLKASMDQYGHVVLTSDLKIYAGGKFSYQCGYCGQHSHNNNVKPHIDSPPKGCSACEQQRTLEHGVRNRYEKWSDHPLWPLLSDETKEQLCDNSPKCSCPQCESELWKGTLTRRDDYFCLCCLDTGRIITSNGRSAGTVYQNLLAIKELIDQLDENPMEHFEDQISFEDSNIVITVTVNGEIQSLFLTQWKREEKRPYSKILHQVEDQYLVLKGAFPNYELIESDDPDVVYYKTGFGTMVPSGEVIPHPPTKYPIRQLAPLHNRAGGKHRQSKNMERGENEVDWEEIRSKLSYLYDLKNATLGSPKKTSGDIEARYKLRAAIVGNGHIPLENRRGVRVVHGHLSSIDYIKTSGHESKCLFFCGDNRHPPESQTPDARLANIFEKKTGRRKPGFCPKCLKASGLLGIDFRRLEQEAEIVALKR